MVVEFGADFVPVVFLTADNADTGENDAVVVEGQEGIKEEMTADEEKTVEGEGTVGEEAVMEGEDTVTEDAAAAEGDVLPEEELLGSGAVYENEMEDMDMTGEEVQTAKDPFLSKPVFIGGVSLGVLAVGGVLGFLLARRKIKKGIEIYEDI